MEFRIDCILTNLYNEVVQMRRYKESRESNKTKYYKRALKRFIWVVVYLFILYSVVMGIIWAAPKIWHWALG